MEHGQDLEKAVFCIRLDPDQDGRLLAPDFPPPSEREIDLEVYTRGMNTDFSLPNH